jgi:hypothetical protein
MRCSLARVLAGILFFPVVSGAKVQTPPAPEAKPASIEVSPSSLRLEVGQKQQLTAAVKDENGNVLPGAQVVFFSGSRKAVGVTPSGLVEAYRPGEHKVVALSPLNPFEGEPDSYTSGNPGIRAEVVVTVPTPPLEALEFLGLPKTIYAGTTLPVRVNAKDVTGERRGDVRASLAVSDPQMATTDGIGEVTFSKPGKVTLTASAESVKATADLVVVENPIRSLELTASKPEARTGDVIHFRAVAKDAEGRAVEDAPLTFVLANRPDPNHALSLGAGAPAQVMEDGRFVAEQPGIYTVLAIAGREMARASVQITQRNVRRRIELVGHAPVSDRVTSDVWVWEGVDGRDYAVHGTWNAEGHAYFYDVTDPSKMELVDKVQVDARTVNDVKVSEDGRICVISREGASNRRNGIVVLDVTNPRDVQILSQFDDQLTGGVHNVFIHDQHVYVVNNGRRWDVINVEDPRRPARAARFETTTPGRTVHDVWVRDGVAYQAGNTDGVILVDVGGGGKGGSPSKPVEMGRIPQLTGWSHSVWPFQSKSAGKFYVAGGDEAFWDNPLAPGVGISWKERIPSYAEGWVHFIEFDDVQNPREVARYQVPESGPHNYWIDWEKEMMYVAHFNAGLRVVDISGELLGDLYRQGREIAKFYSDDPTGFIPNAPFAWGPQPHKGTIFFSDLYSGLWAVRLVPLDPPKEPAGAPEGGSR